MRRPYFPGSRGYMNSSNFFARRLDKHKTLFILFLPRLQLHESFLLFSIVVPQTEARSLNFHARWKLFFDSLDFLLNNFYTFFFFFSMADASFAFFFILMLFRTSTFASFLFFPDMNLFSSNRCSVPLRIRFLLGNQAATLSMRSMD